MQDRTLARAFPPRKTRGTEKVGQIELDSFNDNPQVAKDRKIAMQMENENSGPRRSTRSSAGTAGTQLYSELPPRSKRKPKNDNSLESKNKRPRDSRSADNASGENEEEIKIPPPWAGPLLFPFHGPKRTNVDHEDLKRLQKKEFLNDNIINFYLRYLEEDLKERDPELANEFHFFNTFFYERLSMKGDKKQNMDGVLKWTAKTDLFKKNYVIVPINER